MAACDLHLQLQELIATAYRERRRRAFNPPYFAEVASTDDALAALKRLVADDRLVEKVNVYCILGHVVWGGALTQCDLSDAIPCPDCDEPDDAAERLFDVRFEVAEGWRTALDATAEKKKSNSKQPGEADQQWLLRRPQFNVYFHAETGGAIGGVNLHLGETMANDVPNVKIVASDNSAVRNVKADAGKLDLAARKRSTIDGVEVGATSRVHFWAKVAAWIIGIAAIVSGVDAAFNVREKLFGNLEPAHVKQAGLPTPLPATTKP